jgi:hypothetical protein
MQTSNSEYIFNFNALGFGAVMFLFILFVHATYMFFLNRHYEVITDKLIADKKFGLVPIVFYVTAFFLSASHLIEIGIWGFALNITGLVPNANLAVSFAGSTYTTVGFGADPLPISWELVTVIIALSGMVAFGWSISVLIGMTRIVYIAHKKRRLELVSDLNE